jgi:hypothetical protein
MKRQNSGTAPQWVTPHNRPADVVARAADLISSEGPGGFLRAAGRFLTTSAAASTGAERFASTICPSTRLRRCRSRRPVMT